MSTAKKTKTGAPGSAEAAPKWKKPRKCLYCKARFTPKRPQDADSKFCEPNHRKMYHRYGALPFDKFREAMRKEIKLEVRAEVKAQLAEPVEQMRRDLADLLRVAYTTKGTATA